MERYHVQGAHLKKKIFHCHNVIYTFIHMLQWSEVKRSDHSRRTMSVMVKRLLMRSRFDHQYFLQLKTSSSAMNQNTPLWTTEKSPMVRHTMKRWRGWILARNSQHKRQMIIRKSTLKKNGVELTCTLTGSYEDKTNRLNRLKRKWATRLKLSVLSDLWMEFSSDLALRRPLTQPNKQVTVNINKPVILTSSKIISSNMVKQCCG